MLYHHIAKEARNKYDIRNRLLGAGPDNCWAIKTRRHKRALAVFVNNGNNTIGHPVICACRDNDIYEYTKTSDDKKKSYYIGRLDNDYCIYIDWSSRRMSGWLSPLPDIRYAASTRDF
jgi:hypothetical protein